jgi:ketosteroid isomerase-like protein
MSEENVAGPEEAGPEQNIEGLEAAYAAFARRDYAAMVELFDADIEVREPPELPGASVSRGREGAVRTLMKLQEAFADMEFRTHDFRQIDDCVLVSMDWVGRGVGSGVQSRVGLWHVWWFRNGLAVRVHAYLDRAEALEATGLRG